MNRDILSNIYTFDATSKLDYDAFYSFTDSSVRLLNKSDLASLYPHTRKNLESCFS